MDTPCNIRQNTIPTLTFPTVEWRQDVLLTEPILLFPRPNATLCLEASGASGVVLSWLSVPSATHYLVQWGNNAQLSGPTVRENITTNTFQILPSGLDFRLGETVYWRVQAANLTTGGISPRSEVRSISYNCGDGAYADNLQATRAPAFDIDLDVFGPSRLASRDEATYWLSATFSEYDMTGRQICCLSEVNWTVSDEDAVIVRRDDFKIRVRTKDSTPKVFTITANVVFWDKIQNTCFTVSASKEVFLDAESDNKPIIKIKLKESLPQCGEALAVELHPPQDDVPSDSGSSGSGSCSCIVTSSSSGSDYEPDCCQEGESLIVWDAIGNSKLLNLASHKYSPEDSIGYAVWNCGRWELLKISSIGCCSSANDDCCISFSTFDLRCEDGELNKYVKTQTICLEQDCVVSEETDWIFIEQVGCCSCDCCSSSSGSGSDEPAPLGRCCLNGNCSITTEAECAGIWIEGANCDGSPCVDIAMMAAIDALEIEDYQTQFNSPTWDLAMEMLE